MSSAIASDVAFGSFTDAGPWVIDLDALPWRRDLVRVRDAVHRSIPELTRYERVPPVARMLTPLRHLGVPMAVGAVRARKPARSTGSLSRRLRVAAEHLGP